MDLIEESFVNNLLRNHPNGLGKHFRIVPKNDREFSEQQRADMLLDYEIPFVISDTTKETEDSRLYLCVLGSDMVVHGIDNKWPDSDMIKNNLEANLWFIKDCFVAVTGRDVFGLHIYKLPPASMLAGKGLIGDEATLTDTSH